MGEPQKRTNGSSFRPVPSRTARLRVEELETRLTPTWSGYPWPSAELITLSFVPDGTIIGAGVGGTYYSNMFAKFNSHPGWTTATWQNKIIAAAQSWAQQTNINFDIIADNGTTIGNGDYQQGDPDMGDIRVSGYPFLNNWLASAYLPSTMNNFSIAGDFHFNTNKAFNIGTHYDLYSVAAHEIGHALGLSHSTIPLATMFPNYNVIKNALHADDIASIRAGYGGARVADTFDAAASNGSFATASNLTALIDPVSLTAVQTGLDITSTSDVDYYTFTAPADTSGTLSVQVRTDGLSLLRQAVTVYAANQTTVLGSGSSAGAYDGTTQTITITGVTPDQVFYVKVAGADSTAFGTGVYALTLNLGSGDAPTVPLPDTQLANGNPIQGGGGEFQGGRWWENQGYEVLGVGRPWQEAIARIASGNSQSAFLDQASRVVTAWQQGQTAAAGSTSTVFPASVVSPLVLANLLDRLDGLVETVSSGESLSDLVFQSNSLFTLLSAWQQANG